MIIIISPSNYTINTSWTDTERGMARLCIHMPNGLIHQRQASPITMTTWSRPTVNRHFNSRPSTMSFGSGSHLSHRVLTNRNHHTTSQPTKTSTWMPSQKTCPRSGEVAPSKCHQEETSYNRHKQLHGRPYKLEKAHLLHWPIVTHGQTMPRKVKILRDVKPRTTPLHLHLHYQVIQFRPFHVQHPRGSPPSALTWQAK